MSSAESDHQPVESQENGAPAKEGVYTEDAQATDSQAEVAVPADGEAPHDATQEAVPAAPADAPEENANEQEEEELGGEELADPRVFKLAAHDVDECCMSVIRGLSAFSQEDEEIFGSAVDICNDIISMEQNLFSEPPPYVSRYIAMYRARTDAYNSTVQARESIPTAEGTSRDWEERRAYVDPGVPLMLPYSSERFKREHPEHAQTEGTYHDLFYGDGTQVVFAPPPDNKRQQLEEAKKKTFTPTRQSGVSYDPPQKKPMRVSADFVPACAATKDPQPAKRRRSSIWDVPKKSQRKSAGKKWI